MTFYRAVELNYVEGREVELRYSGRDFLSKWNEGLDCRSVGTQVVVVEKATLCSSSPLKAVFSLP